MTADEFEAAYAERSGLKVSQLRELGRIVAPCDCGADECEGWQSTTQERLDEDEAFRKWLCAPVSDEEAERAAYIVNALGGRMKVRKLEP